MGDDLKRPGTLKQINRDAIKTLVPVWNHSLADDRGEESQPVVYQGVIYLPTHAVTMAIDAKTGKQIWRTKVEYPPRGRASHVAALSTGEQRSSTGRYSAPRLTQM
jgi:alcohol dehydrogenase (cytochrome c)